MADDERDRIDFSSLDPVRDSERFERRVAEIAHRAESLLAERQRIDLGALDPTREPGRFNALVGTIMERAAFLLAQRRNRSTALGQLARWQRPVAAAAAIILIVSLAVLTRVAPSSAGTVEEEPGFTEAMGIPTPIAQWMGAEQPPTAAEFLFTLAEN